MTDTALCDCGKPTSHKGMCSARWAKRKANNGPAGIKSKEPPVAPIAAVSEEAIARRLFGDMADDILLLRRRGHDVARFKGDFRVDREVLTGEQLSAKAKALRQKSSGGRGVGDNPAPHGLAPSEKGPSAPSDAVPLPVEAGQDCAGAGNAAISEQSPERMPLAAPPLDPKDLRARVAQLEQRVEFLLAVVADAIGGRRVTLLVSGRGAHQARNSTSYSSVTPQQQEKTWHEAKDAAAKDCCRQISPTTLKATSTRRRSKI